MTLSGDALEVVSTFVLFPPLLSLARFKNGVNAIFQEDAGGRKLARASFKYTALAGLLQKIFSTWLKEQ
jgi:hypothetical protein